MKSRNTQRTRLRDLEQLSKRFLLALCSLIFLISGSAFATPIQFKQRTPDEERSYYQFQQDGEFKLKQNQFVQSVDSLQKAQHICPLCARTLGYLSISTELAGQHSASESAMATLVKIADMAEERIILNQPEPSLYLWVDGLAHARDAYRQAVHQHPSPIIMQRWMRLLPCRQASTLENIGQCLRRYWYVRSHQPAAGAAQPPPIEAESDVFEVAEIPGSAPLRRVRVGGQSLVLNFLIASENNHWSSVYEFATEAAEAPRSKSALSVGPAVSRKYGATEFWIIDLQQDSTQTLEKQIEEQHLKSVLICQKQPRAKCFFELPQQCTARQSRRDRPQDAAMDAEVSHEITIEAQAVSVRQKSRKGLGDQCASPLRGRYSLPTRSR